MCRSKEYLVEPVFRTMTGFHDAYVAAPSRAVAIRASGAVADLFAMDAAEQVSPGPSELLRVMRPPFVP